MKQRLVDYLMCPSCNGEIRLLSVAACEGAEVLEGTLACDGCERRFPILRGVPRFVEADEISPDKAHTAENFGWQWRHFAHADDRYLEQFLGWVWPVTPDFFSGKVVLEAGCGKGRHTRLAAAWGAREVIAVDLSDAVEQAFAAAGRLPNVHIIQADIYQLPVRGVFDYVYSVGVLHHLPDPRAGFLRIAAKVRAGGFLSAWVYGAENNEWLTRWVGPVRERVTARIGKRPLLHLSKLPTAALYAATKLIYGPLNESPRGQALARHLFYNDYLKSLAGFDWREQHTIVFDHLVAPTSHYIARDEFDAWWREAGARDLSITWHNRNSWRGFGRIGG